MTVEGGRGDKPFQTGVLAPGLGAVAGWSAGRTACSFSQYSSERTFI